MNTFFLPGRKSDQERLGEPWAGPTIGLAKHCHCRGLNRGGTGQLVWLPRGHYFS